MRGGPELANSKGGKMRGDAISRSMLLMAYDREHVGPPGRARKLIERAPSIPPKMVIYTGDGYADGNMVYDQAECPSCGYEYDEGEKDWGKPFCPQCGQPLICDTVRQTFLRPMQRGET